MATAIRKIGVLTGGGDCPGLNAVLRAITKTAISEYGMEVIGFLDGFKGMTENNYKILDIPSVSGILHTGGTILGSSNRDNPFYFACKTESGVEFADLSDQALDNIKSLGIEALIVIGGDGSLHIAQDFADKGLPVVGVPKTIDNDLAATDFTFGFYTAVNTATAALDKLHTTAESHHRIMILEVMGRYAGWIALHSGVAGGADVILIPEIPYRVENVLEKIKQRNLHGKKFSLIVVAEGAASENGEFTVKELGANSYAPVRLGGAGQKLADELAKISDLEIRVTVLGHLQRGGTPIPYDRILATRYGVAAVRLVAGRQFGNMVSLQGTQVNFVPLGQAIEKIKQVDPQGDFVQDARDIGISFGA